jgi:pimeloyl-ACP methyl ester carboxylesterase
LVYVMGWLTHLELSWEPAGERSSCEALGQGCRLVSYDRAGCGLSDPTVRPPTLAFDLEQVIRAAGFSRVAIERYRLHTPFVPFNSHIAGRADA